VPFNPQLGIVEETTFGTPPTVTRFYDYGSASLKQDIERIEYMGLRPNRKSLGLGNWVPGRIGVTGDIELPVMNNSMALWFKHCLGSVATTTPTGGTTTRDHKCTQGTLDGKSLTIQEGIPPISGAAQAFTWSGCKIAKWGLKHDTQSQLMLTLSIDGSVESTAVGLATASYAAGLTPYAYTKGVITVAGSSFDVKDWSLDADNGLATDRYFIRSTTPGSKKEQLEAGGIREYTGSLTAEFTDTTAYNRFVNGTAAALTAVYTGATIEGALNYQITVSLGSVRFDGETPAVGGFDIVEQPLPFKVLDDPAVLDGPVVVVVRCTDTAP
jgi:hypothetical protein